MKYIFVLNDRSDKLVFREEIQKLYHFGGI